MKEQYSILIVDDDAEIVNILRTALKDAGYQTHTARNGDEACSLAERLHPHLIIMDVMMPQCNGMKGTDRILGLEAGADDYLVKPFLQQELLARVKALLRRYDALGSIRERGSEDQIRVGDVILDTAKKQLLVRGEPVRLTPTEYKLLLVLMSNPGRVFSAEELYERVWENEVFAVENTVMVHISRIREKLELNPKKPEYLKVVWGIGYVFEAP